MKTLDLRSDTITKPSPDMLASMMKAEVGDDVYGEDSSTNTLEEMGAEVSGKEAALFCPSGTQSNLLALLTHCARGDEYIVGQQAHNYKYEGGGGAVFGSIQPQPLNLQADGTFDLDEVARNIKADDFHFAKTTLLCIENTYSGLALPLPYLEQCCFFAEKQGLKLHMDGARLFNASCKWDIDATQMTENVDSVSLCLSKGLGAPVGSLLCGNSSFINTARRWRKVLGGGMRQTGYMAAAGIYALKNNITRLSEDQHNAEALARGLRDIDEIGVVYQDNQTNMVFITIPEKSLPGLHVYLRQNGIVIPAGPSIRLVTHLEIDRPDIDFIVNTFKHYFSNTK